jgi:hypothetical protein
VARRPHFLLLLLGIAVGVGGCEDRALAMDAANLGNLREVMAALICRAPEGYPRQLVELSEASGSCPPVGWLKRATPEGQGLRYAGYVWTYKQAHHAGSSTSGFEVQAVAQPVRPEGCSRCRSFWLSEAGRITWARGRPATATDPELQID